MIFVGVDWAEAHHDVCVLDRDGEVLARTKIPDSLEGVRALHELVAPLAEEPHEVVVGIEKDRGLIVTAMLGANYRVYALNPMSVARYRERHVTSGSKSDPGDAKVLADVVRTDRHNHREAKGDSDGVDALKVIARAHQSAIWSRQREKNALRNALVNYYPGALRAFGTDLDSGDALEVLKVAPTPALGAQLSLAKITSALRRGGRERNLERTAKKIQAALREEQLRERPRVEAAFGKITAAHVAMIRAYGDTIAELEAALREDFEQHPDVAVVLSLPGLGTVLGARVLGEFGDAPNRYADAKSRRNYAGTSPVTKASGKSKVVLARHSRNARLSAAVDQWAFCSLKNSSGARTYYDELRARGKTHRQAIRQLANRLVGILHACLEQHVVYDENLAWKHRADIAA
ncbi:MAG: IS110 family transposase [Acidimicrobiales bacterium]|jgi:transposase/transposase IS116/IS110/IS902 family protein